MNVLNDQGEHVSIEVIHDILDDNNDEYVTQLRIGNECLWLDADELAELQLLLRSI